MVRAFVLLSLLTFLTPHLSAGSSDELNNWAGWIADKHNDIDCPWLMDQKRQRACSWPGQLKMNLLPNGLSFSFTIDIHSQHAIIQLPGDQQHWPAKITINGRSAPIIEKNTKPYVSLDKGHHVIDGTFLWKTKPGALSVPPAIAFVTLQEAGRELVIDRRNDKVIFSQNHTQTTHRKRDSLKIEVYRLLQDGVPVMLETRLKLSVSGKPREISIGKVALDGSVITQMNSPLPARIEQTGDARIQVVAGEHHIRLRSRFMDNPSSLAVQANSKDWPQYEYISFQSNTNLRQTTISGAISIDTSQVPIPEDWQNLPTYRMDNTTTLAIETEFRGDHAPIANQLKINRHLWLDFDGSAITALDDISGNMYQGWRLNAQPDTHIGNATVEEQPVLITKDNNLQGIEIRSPDINLRAVSRVMEPGEFSASGWHARADEFRATLHLPPGWRVLHASGVDTIYGTWISQWDLWDIFLLLMIVAATRKLLSLPAGLLAAITFIVIYHEPGAPVFLVPTLLLVVALLPIIKGRVKHIISIGGAIFSALLLISVVAYAVSSFRLAIYPSLEKEQVNHYQRNTLSSYQTPSSLEEPMQSMEMDAMQSRKANTLEEVVVTASKHERKKTMYQVDDNDRVQTGPGLPTWLWNAIHLQSNSPTLAGQTLSIIYCPPWVTSLWRVLSVFLLAAYAGLLIWRMVKLMDLKRPQTDAATTGASSVAVLILLVTTGLLIPTTQAIAASDQSHNPATYPPQYLLQELEQKLLKAPPCLPACASLNNGRLEVKPSQVILSFNVYADADIALPIPSGRGSWQPSTVIVDGKQQVPAIRKNRQIAIFISKGQHRVSLKGPLSGETASISLPLPIHNFSAHSNTWVIDGIVDGRVVNNTLTLRSKAQIRDDKADSLIPNPIAPLVIVNREFIFGKQWQMKTRVQRLAPQTGAITANIPLLDNEKVLSNSVNIKDGIAQLQFTHQQRNITWLSSLEPTEQIILTAQKADHYLETWRFMPSSLWRLSYQGIPPVKEAGDISSLQPYWKPWPNEQLTVDVSRPAGIQGPTHTVEKAVLNYDAGKQIQKSRLTLTVQSSLGEDYLVNLPDDAEILSLALDGDLLNLPSGTNIKLPLQPGLQTVELEFQQQQPLSWISTTPAIKLPGGATNINIHYSLPKDRWPLYIAGPAIGPAMLYWGVLFVIVLGAIALTMLARKLALDVPVTLFGWLLLGVGLSTVNSYGVLIVSIFFFLLAARKQFVDPWRLGRTPFNSLQCIIIFWTLITALAVISAIPLGLLSNPDMKVVGNGSYSHLYNFYQDRADANHFPVARVFSVSMFSYRLVMLLWSLWLATSVIRWATWWWQAYSEKATWLVKENNTQK